jgi:hypothetical protein
MLLVILAPRFALMKANSCHHLASVLPLFPHVPDHWLLLHILKQRNLFHHVNGDMIMVAILSAVTIKRSCDTTRILHLADLYDLFLFVNHLVCCFICLQRQYRKKEIAQLLVPWLKLKIERCTNDLISERGRK